MSFTRILQLTTNVPSVNKKFTVATSSGMTQPSARAVYHLPIEVRGT